MISIYPISIKISRLVARPISFYSVYFALTIYTVLALCSTPSLAFEETKYPQKIITLVVPFPAGGPTDSSARIIAKALSLKLGQPIVIDNRAGAGGTVGSQFVAKANPDGYTLLWGGTSSLVMAPALYQNLGYDPIQSFSPIGIVVKGPMIIAGRGGLGPKTLSELIDFAKTHQLTFASAGTGSIGHLTGELFKERTQVSLLHIPYKGGAPALNDLLGGQVDLIFETAQFMSAQVKSGAVTAYAVIGASRYSGLPDIPTVNEALSIKGLEAYSWFGLAAPGETPKKIINTLERSLQTIMHDPLVQSQLSAIGLEPTESNAKDMKKTIEANFKTWHELVQRQNIKSE